MRYVSGPQRLQIGRLESPHSLDESLWFEANELLLVVLLPSANYHCCASPDRLVRLLSSINMLYATSVHFSCMIVVLAAPQKM